MMTPHQAQVLTFRLADETFGIDVRRVQAVQAWAPVTKIPETPDYLLGIVDLRGTVVPIVDLRRRLGMEPGDFGPFTVVLIVPIRAGGLEATVGFVADAVSDVHAIPERDRQPAPQLSASPMSRAVQGIGILADRLVIILDVDALVGEEALSGSLRAEEHYAPALGS